MAVGVIAKLRSALRGHIGGITHFGLQSVKTRRRSHRRGGRIPGVAETVLLVDDHAGFRRQARRLLEAGGLNVIGEAADGDAALSSAQELNPDVVLLDVKLPDGDGFAVAERIAEVAARASIVLTSSHELDDLRTRLERTSARGFIPKDDLSAEAIVALVRGPQ
jgi:two-component system nitrate/nitrite response regulator NarL